MNDNPPVPSAPDKLTPAELADHERSVHDYPDINFSPTEYVVINVQRSICGILMVWLFALLVFIAMLAVTILINHTSNNTASSIPSMVNIGLVSTTVGLPLLVGTVGSSVYRKNTFIVTNERVFAHIQYTPFAHRSQNVELEHIEDCSFSQSNPIQMLFNYGTIRLSTIGDEQTYAFTFVANPKEQFKVINHVVQQVDEGEATKYRRKRVNK